MGEMLSNLELLNTTTEAEYVAANKAENDSVSFR
jgi:hypothetical protein